MKNGYIYLIQQESYLKIGFTYDLKKRMKQYRTHNVNYSLLFYIIGPSELEKELHNKFKEYQYQSEWFYYNDEIINYFKDFNRGFLDDDKNLFAIFPEYITPFYELTSCKAKDLCVKLCSMAEYNTGKVDISRAKRIQICKELNINNDNLSTYLTMLKKKNIIKEEKEYKGIYTINPLMFWKGENRLRVDAICNFSVEFVISLNNKQE
mgnify:CR=1 FL=1